MERTSTNSETSTTIILRSDTMNNKMNKKETTQGIYTNRPVIVQDYFYSQSVTGVDSFFTNKTNQK